MTHKSAIEKTPQQSQHNSDYSVASAGPDGAAITPPAYVLESLDVASTQNRPLQMKVGLSAGGGKSAPQNHTGLPDALRAGVESLSGLSLDDVRVHYNSLKPAQLQALAYTQGSDIHVAPGQERHLPHEAWHVVQQRQGRVKPTSEIEGTKINADKNLEGEADRMAIKSLQARNAGSIPSKATEDSSKIVQRKVGFEFQTGVQLQHPKKFTRNSPIEDHGTWSIDPDEIEDLSKGGQKCDLEYVTEPFEEEDSDGLMATMQGIANHAGTLKEKQQIGPEGVTVTALPKIVTAAPQATIGISLNKIAALIGMIDEPIFLGNTLGKSQSPTLFGMVSDTGKMMGQAQNFAAQAVQQKVKKGKGNFAEVEGMLTLIISYLLSSVTLEKTKEPKKYAKLLAPMMSRTNFRAMFLKVEKQVHQLLGYNVEPMEKQGIYWKEEHLENYWKSKGPKGRASTDIEGLEFDVGREFADWILNAAGIDGDTPVFPSGYLTPDLKLKKPLSGPTRRTWLRSIADPNAAQYESIDAREDYMQYLAQIKDFDPTRTDVLSPVPYGSTSLGLRVKETKPKSGQYEVRNPFELGNSLKVILELRRLPKGVPSTEWVSYALRLQSAMLAIKLSGMSQLEQDAWKARSMKNVYQY